MAADTAGHGPSYPSGRQRLVGVTSRKSDRNDVVPTEVGAIATINHAQVGRVVLINS